MTPAQQAALLAFLASPAGIGLAVVFVALCAIRGSLRRD